MKKAIIPAFIIALSAVLISCPSNSPSPSDSSAETGPRFSLVDFSYVRAGFNSREITVGDTVNFDVILQYDAQDIIQIDFYWTYGIDDGVNSNYGEGQGPSYQKSGTDLDISGSYTFRTDFTGVNWVTVKGVAFKQNGDVIIDKVWFNIDNMGPNIDIEPRNLSGVKNLDNIVLRIADGGSDAGVAYNRVSLALKDSGGAHVALSNPSSDGNGTITTAPVRTLSPGSYSITVIGYDNIGNPAEASSNFTLLSSSSALPELSITTPSWNGTTVAGTIEFAYTSSEPIERLFMDSSVFGPTYYPYVFGSFPTFEYLNPSQSGTITLDTTFTGQNPAYFRLFAIYASGLSATSNIVWCNVHN